MLSLSYLRSVKKKKKAKPIQLYCFSASNLSWIVNKWYVVEKKVTNILKIADNGVTQPPRCREDEFTCRDGTCIPQSAVCDERADCPYADDEANCLQGRSRDMSPRDSLEWWEREIEQEHVCTGRNMS